jgi:hypothetical protein
MVVDFGRLGLTEIYLLLVRLYIEMPRRRSLLIVY